MSVGTLQAAALREGYARRAVTPSDTVREVYERIAARGADSVWIHLRDVRQVLDEAAQLPGRVAGGASLPLFGLPFAVKGNIDVAGLRTTAACPAFGEVATTSATLVRRLLQAGALLIGTTNLDQFATGLNGTRSPHGTPRNPLDPTLIPGGSSSGSGVAVAAGLVTFAIGTDTAGSGRVPAAMTNTVGLKPSLGLVSTAGIVPACRSLDCPSVHALSVEDATLVLSVIAGVDAADPWSRALPAPTPRPPALDLRQLRVGVPAHGEGLEVSGLAELGPSVVPVDLAPFLEAGSLLYGGPWIAERLADLAPFLDAHPDDVHPVTAAVLASGRGYSAAEAFGAQHRLRALSSQIEPIWRDLDVLAVPTTPSTFTVAELAADPIGRNAALGQYTTFVNLLDLAALAVPAGFTDEGRPRSVTLIGPRGSDGLLAALGSALHRRAALPLGATGFRLLDEEPRDDGALAGTAGSALLAVVGAHLAGLPLHHQLLDAAAALVLRTRTDADYRLFALDGPGPARPGLVRRPGAGAAIETEVYRIGLAELGRFLTGVRAPLAIGTVRLAGGQDVLGFLCEPYAVENARDITDLGGWRAYLRSLSP